MLLRPVRSANAFEETVQRLLQSIRLGLIGPGQRLPPERELAVMLSVSRDTLREAIAALHDAGYVVSRRGRYGGTFVTDVVPTLTPVVDERGELSPRREIPRAEIEDALALRRILEVGAAHAAALRQLSATEREQLWQLTSECDAVSGEPGGNGTAEYRRYDSRLHLYIAELVGAPSLVRLVAETRMRINELLDTIPLLPPNIEHSNQQHERIITAILHGNADAAAAAMAEHCDGSEALLRGFLT